MFDICANAINKGESGCIRCIDKPLMDMAMSGKITVTSYDDNGTIDTLDFFTHLRDNNMCMKTFFPTEMMRGKLIEENGFNREYDKIIILTGLKKFIEHYTPYVSYKGKYGFKLFFKNGIKIHDDTIVNEVYIILIKLCINNHSSAFVSSFNSKAFKSHMLAALNLLHSNGYCHKDLHIGNFVLCFGPNNKPQYKLIDFEHMSKCDQEDGKEERELVKNIAEEQIDEKRDLMSFLTSSVFSVFSRSKLGGRRKKRTQKMVMKRKTKTKPKSKRVQGGLMGLRERFGHNGSARRAVPWKP